MKRGEEGFILVAMIWIIAILTVITLGFAHRALIDQRASALTLDHSRAQFLARGAVTYAVADMRNAAYMDGLIERARAQLAGTRTQFRRGGASQRPAATTIKPTHESPNLFAEAGIYSDGSAGEGNKAAYTVVDAEGRISVNTAPEELLDNVEGLGMRTISAIMRHRGGELTPEDRNLFLTVEEVRHLDDIDDGAWEGQGDDIGLRDLFTVYGDGRINVNSASREVLAAVPDLDKDIVDRIVQHRAGEDGKLGTDDDRLFQTLVSMSGQLGMDPTRLAPLARYCTFESHYFTITGFATQRQGKVRAAAQAVVHMQPGSATVLAWSEGELGPQNAY